MANNAFKIEKAGMGVIPMPYFLFENESNSKYRKWDR